MCYIENDPSVSILFLMVKKRKMKILNSVLAVMFILFAAVQYNDPDPYIWMPIYLLPAAVCGFAAVGRVFDRRVILAGMVVLGIYAISYLPDFFNWIKMGMPSIVQTMKAETPFVELTREFFAFPCRK